MTRTQFRKKAKELKREVNRLIDNRIEKAINSGCLPLEDYENDFRLPKAFMSAMGNEIKFQFKPLNRQETLLAKNIELFL